MITVHAIQCPSCEDVVFSRSRHDMRGCSCGEVAIDGGFDYQKVSFRLNPPKRMSLNINVTKAELFKDWNEKIDEHGLIKKSD